MNVFVANKANIAKLFVLERMLFVKNIRGFHVLHGNKVSES